MNLRELIESSDCTSVYHLPEWLGVLKKVHGHTPVLIEDKNCFLPLARVNSMLFGNRLISLPFADYGGPLCLEKPDLNSLIKKLLSTQLEPSIDFIELRSPNPHYVPVLIQNGFVERVDYCTFVLDLTPGVDKIFSHLEKRVRNDVVKSQKMALNLQTAKNEDDVKVFYEIYLHTMKNLGSPPQPFEFFRELWAALKPLDAIDIRFVLSENKPVSAAMFFPFKNKLHYAYSCSLPEARSVRATDWLLSEVISQACARGFTHFDFGRTRLNSGVYVYKKGWGGKEVAMPYYYFFNKKQLKQRQEVKYAGLSKAWSAFMPKPLAKILGPWLIKQIG